MVTDFPGSSPSVNFMKAPPGNDLKEYNGAWHVRINDQWRLSFKWGENGPYDDIVVHTPIRKAFQMHTDTPAIPSSTGPWLHQLTLDDLATHGWSRQNHFLPRELTLALAAECRVLAAGGALGFAAVGRGTGQTLRPEIRGDRTLWLEAGQSDACDLYRRIMETLRLALNRAFFLGLDDYESHFALYAPGASYSRHLDRFRDDDLRIVSAVIYLNPDWLPGQGGALRLHPPGEPARDVVPLGSRLVLFMSAEMPHEVLPATRERLSLAGWFRRRAP
ncbi:2OG-Fe(II) oxygenase [Pseudoduganella namucuonensis]|uniref:SM-20-related protein n=1 Tax=Pseudoduganella namucuonensis TaxID=1035707 RepID=A0A1I7LNM6_9BURK|nr:2OG-Fe(II) oxygenase [Pseudoduganella namucuonensis]SFV11243.1 SM-20-related protein [Pseudoduganella namucuonensis]